MKDFLLRAFAAIFLTIVLLVGGCQIIADLGLWPYISTLFFNPLPPV